MHGHWTLPHKSSLVQLSIFSLSSLAADTDFPHMQHWPVNMGGFPADIHTLSWIKSGLAYGKPLSETKNNDRSSTPYTKLEAACFDHIVKPGCTVEPMVNVPLLLNREPRNTIKVQTNCGKAQSSKNVVGS